MVRKGILDSNTHNARVKIKKNMLDIFPFGDSAKFIIIIIKSFMCNPISQAKLFH